MTGRDPDLLADLDRWAAQLATGQPAALSPADVDDLRSVLLRAAGYVEHVRGDT